MLALVKYLTAWIAENYEALAQSEWYSDCFDGEKMDDIEPEFFITTYLVPLIQSNIKFDFGADIDALRLLMPEELN